MEAYAANGVNVEDGEGEGAQQQQARDVIFSGTVSDDEDPLVIVNEVENAEDVVNYVYVIWKLDTFLSQCSLDYFFRDEQRRKKELKIKCSGVLIKVH